MFIIPCMYFRLDQTLGKPGSWFVGTDRDKQKMTIVARLSRVESQVSAFEPQTLLNSSR